MTTFPPLPTTIAGVDGRHWETYQPYYESLIAQPLAPDSSRTWLQNWSELTKLFHEVSARIYIAKTQDTTDQDKQTAFLELVDNVFPKATVAEQTLKERLLAQELADPDLALILRAMRNEAELFREENVPLQTELQKLENEYDNITGRLQADWDGQQKNVSQLEALLEDKDRTVRERAWQVMCDLWLGSRAELNELYAKMVALRTQIAHNAGLPDYRAYAFREKNRFDYTPADCLTFHEAIEQVVVPAARRVLARKQAQLGLELLRPWDVKAEAGDAPALKPYEKQDDLVRHGQAIFAQIDAELSGYFNTMAAEELLDLDTRPGKALGGYCDYLPVSQRPFIFMNGVGTHGDVQTLFHEAGHAFHGFKSGPLPLVWHSDSPMEFNEVASMAMELLTAPYLTHDQGGFYTPAEAARARINHLEEWILFLPYMAVVDAFQHWVYTHPTEAQVAANCDATWGSLWDRFMPVADWTGYEAARVTGWHRKLHIFQVPFYYIEYGMAQVGALQVWRNSLQDPAGALAAYKQALALGGTKPLPEIYAAAGIEFRFDVPMLTELTRLMEQTIADLSAVA